MPNIKSHLLVAVLVFVAASAGAGWLMMLRPLPMRAEATSFSVPPGASLRTAAQVVETAGIDLPAWQLELLGRILGRSAKIKAGSYEVPRGLTALALLEILTRGDVTQGEIVLVEGKTFRQFRAALNASPDLVHDSLALTDQQILVRLGLACTGWVVLSRRVTQPKQNSMSCRISNS